MLWQSQGFTHFLSALLCLLCSVHTSRKPHLGRFEMWRGRGDMCLPTLETSSSLTSSPPLASSTRYTTWRWHWSNTDHTQNIQYKPHQCSITWNLVVFRFIFWLLRCGKVISGWWPPQSVAQPGCRCFFQSSSANCNWNVFSKELVWLVSNQLDFDAASKLPQVCFLYFNILTEKREFKQPLLCSFDQVYRFPFLEMESLTYWSEENRWIHPNSTIHS